MSRLVKWVTSSNPDFQIFNTSQGYGTSVTVRDSNTLHQSQLGHQSLYKISATVRDYITYTDYRMQQYEWKMLALYSYLSQIWRRRSPWQRNARPAAIRQSTPTYLWCLVMDYWGCNLKCNFTLTRSICWLVNLLLEVKLLFTYQSQ